MKKFTPTSRIVLIALATVLATNIASAQNIYLCEVLRHDFFTQSTTNRASTVNGTSHYLDATTQLFDGAQISSPTIKPPGGQQHALTSVDSTGLYLALQPSLSYSNPAPKGTYEFRFVDSPSTWETVHVTLSAPATAILPLRIANWTEAQTIDASQDFTMSWDKAVNSGAHDYLLFEIRDANSTAVFTQKMPLTQTNVVITASTLQPNIRYNAYLSVFHYFSINNRTVPYSLAGEQRYTQFHIQTINPAGELSFSARAQTVLETDGTAYIKVRRTQGTQGQVTVDYFTDDGTAHSNVDYTAVSGTFVFPDGVSSQLVEIPLLNNPTHGAPVTVHMSLTNATGGATLNTHPHTAVTIRDPAAPSVPTVAGYELATIEFYRQSSAGAASQTTFDITSEFSAIVFPGFPGSISFGVLEGPRGNAIPLERTFDNYRAFFENDQRFPSTTSMATTIRAGRYSFYVEDLSGNVFTTNLIVGAERKIAPPVVSNWTAAQAVDPTQDFVLDWGRFVGGTTNDYVKVIVEDAAQEYIVYTPPEFEVGALRPPKQGYVIPANTLEYGKTYNALVAFIKVQNRLTPGKGIPAAITSVAGTWFTLKTIDSPSLH